MEQKTDLSLHDILSVAIAGWMSRPVPGSYSEFADLMIGQLTYLGFPTTIHHADLPPTALPISGEPSRLDVILCNIGELCKHQPDEKSLRLYVTAYVNEAKALRSHPQAPAPGEIPEGWKLVPIKPTPEMAAAARPALDAIYETGRILTFDESATEGYMAMLAVSPSQPASGEGKLREALEVANKAWLTYSASGGATALRLAFGDKFDALVQVAKSTSTSVIDPAMREAAAKIVEKKIDPSELPPGCQSGENLWLNEVEHVLAGHAEQIRALGIETSTRKSECHAPLAEGQAGESK